MKTPRLTLPLLLAILSLAASVTDLRAAKPEDWTLDDVLAQVLHANGGKESVDAVTNIRIRGAIEGPDGTVEFLLLKKRPDKMRIRLAMQGRAIESGFDGLNGWRRFTQGDVQKVVAISGEDLFQLRQDADFDGPLVGPVAEGMERRLAGIERIDRVDYFIIEVSKPGVLSRHYVDSRTFRELKVVQQRTLDSGEVRETTILYDDYKRYGGIWVAMRSERHLPDGQTELVNVIGVDINPAVLDRAFAMPEG